MSRPAEFGLTPLAWRLIAIQTAVLVVSAWLDVSLGLRIAWGTTVPSIVGLTMVLVLWLSFVVTPGNAEERVIAEAVLALFLLLLFTNIGAAAQYPAVALDRPLVDGWLARADLALGVNVADLAAWTRAHPTAARILSLGYASLVAQFSLPILLLGLVFRDRTRLWEFLFHFHVCLAATLAALAVFPSECAFTHYGFLSTIDQTRFVRHFTGFRQGTLTTIRFDDLEGLISMPSFHVAGALMVTWAFRGRWTCWPLAVLNVVLVLATVMSGAHYAIDVVATFALFAGSVLLWRASAKKSFVPS